MPFPTVVIGQKIRASWGNAAAARFNDAHAVLAFSPGANTDANTGGGIATWLTLGNVTVPAWAVSAIVDFYLVGPNDITAAPNQYDLRLSIGAANGPTHRCSGQTAVSVRFAIGFADRITLAATGSQSVVLAANRVAGTGQWRLDTVGDVMARFTFLDT